MFICSRCHTPVDDADCYCRHCGRPLRPRLGFWHSHSGIFLLTLLLGPFSLIWVWRSHRISPIAKWLWTLCIGAATVYLFYCVYKVLLLMQYLLPIY